MGIDEISSQPQGGRLAPADGGCIQRGKVCAQLAQQYRFKTINVIRRREQDQETPGRVGLLVEGLRIERHFACVFAELLSTMLEVIHVEDNRNAVSLKELIYTRIFSPIVNPSFGSLLYSLSYVLFCFVPCLVLFRKRIFIKI